MLSLARRSRGPQRLDGPVSISGSSHTRDKRSRNKVFFAFAALVLLGCAFNLRLHSNATVVISRQRSENSDPSRVDVVGERVRATVEGQSNGANATTLSPTTATWSPVQSQLSRVPEQNHENERLYLDKQPMTHPRVACFIHDDINNGSRHTSCNSVANITPKKKTNRQMPSIPLEVKSHEDDKADADDVNKYRETDTCKYPDPTCQATSIAPPTCNDIHSLGVDSHMFQNQHQLAHRSSIKYVTTGGAKSVWKVRILDDKHEEETVIFKSNKNSRFLKRQFWDQNRRDALISGRMGNTQLSRIITS
mmetsp:Transcript_17499/g.37843  ORF Transcript_17499/g.37843 Transcript_17499/m.37843 type:complete len:307 (+) Transcript_17499:32-952(+)